MLRSSTAPSLPFELPASLCAIRRKQRRRRRGRCNSLRRARPQSLWLGAPPIDWKAPGGGGGHCQASPARQWLKARRPRRHRIPVGTCGSGRNAPMRRPRVKRAGRACGRARVALSELVPPVRGAPGAPKHSQQMRSLLEKERERAHWRLALFAHSTMNSPRRRKRASERAPERAEREREREPHTRSERCRCGTNEAATRAELGCRLHWF